MRKGRDGTQHTPPSHPEAAGGLTSAIQERREAWQRGQGCAGPGSSRYAVNLMPGLDKAVNTLREVRSRNTPGASGRGRDLRWKNTEEG